MIMIIKAHRAEETHDFDAHDTVRLLAGTAIVTWGSFSAACGAPAHRLIQRKAKPQQD